MGNKSPPTAVYDNSTLREAADHMVNHDVGRLPVLSRDNRKLLGIITRSDILSGYRKRLEDLHVESQEINLHRKIRRGMKRIKSRAS